MTKVKDILAMPIGQGTGGYELTIKTAKKAWEVGGIWYHYVMLTDGESEILGCVQLVGNVRLLRNTPIHITVGERAEYDVNNKMTPALFIGQWADASPVMSEPGELDPWGKTPEEWKTENDGIIRGKCRFGVVCAIRRKHGVQEGPLSAEDKRIINMDVDFIMTGK